MTIYKHGKRFYFQSVINIPVRQLHWFFGVIILYLTFKLEYGRKTVFIVTQNFESHFRLF